MDVVITGEGLYQLSETGGDVWGTAAVSRGGGDGSEKSAAYLVSLKDSALGGRKKGQKKKTEKGVDRKRGRSHCVPCSFPTNVSIALSYYYQLLPSHTADEAFE
jgi:hypothetical protein